MGGGFLEKSPPYFFLKSDGKKLEIISFYLYNDFSEIQTKGGRDEKTSDSISDYRYQRGRHLAGPEIRVKIAGPGRND
jgi:hypothetical protein